MANTIIYAASAGSGKTFSLVTEYLWQIIRKPKAYKNILCVTFTNKATLEMKQRIINVLASITQNAVSAQPYIESLVSKGLNAETIQANAPTALNNILHDYSNFYVETIDSFFQRILRNLTKEIGVGSSFNLLLEDKDYTRQAVKNIIEAADKNPQLRSWLNDFAQERIEKSERWNYEKVLTDFASNTLRQSIVRDNINSDSLQLDSLLQSIKQLKNQTNAFVGKIKGYGKELLSRSKEAGLGCDDFKQKSRGIYSKFARLASYNVRTKDDLSIAEADNDISKWLNKEDIGSYKEDIIREKLMPIYFEVNKAFESDFKAYLSCRCILSRIYEIGLLNNISAERAELLRDDNVFVLNDTSALLSRMIEGNDDISFIYEKTGAIIKHIMIDEFQDTSLTDWQNFSLLVRECLANGNDCFLFGDVKQAIYRWRESDWEILNSLISSPNQVSIPYYQRIIHLNQNWRTDNNIVRFNNQLFAAAYGQIIPSIAQNLEQKSNKNNGQVRVAFIKTPPKENKDANMLAFIKDEIDYYLDCGYKVSDIAVLVRNNDNISKIAQYLQEVSTPQRDYCPSSDEAFAYSSSASVMSIIHSLQYLEDSSNTIALAWLLNQQNEPLEQWLDKDFLHCLRLKKDKPLTELVIDIMNHLHTDRKSAFVSSFLDAVMEYVSKNGSDVRNFLAYWENDLCNKKIAQQEESNSLRITSIHKAKGLEYPIVIVPYCNWKMNKPSEHLILENKNDISPIRLFASTLASLEKTFYDEEYAHECLLQQVDNLNLLYVALTRPQHSLSIIAEKAKAEKPYKNVAALLYDSITNNAEFKAENNEKLERFLLGSDEYQPSRQPNNVSLSRPLNLDFQNARLSLSNEAKRYFTKQSQDSSLKRGLIFHRLMSLIRTKNDINAALNKIYQEYNSDKATIDAAKQTLDLMMSYCEPYQWFDKKYKVLIEQPLLRLDDNKTPQTLRPDRIMIGENEVIILDYKFSANQNAISDYRNQISEYSDVLSQMGYADIKAFLWFIAPDNSQSIIRL
ncbi:MAG: UvrD-helicase domain-containing protein [Bacteroidales bacterium]|nr:UvrD-helicase domain-containing protein [Bacteroidales bacterium]